MEKQIEEMAKDIEISDRESVQYCHNVKCKDCHYFYRYEDCYIRRIAENLVDKGYRKASDVAREIIEISKKGAEKYINDITLHEGIRNMLSVILDDFVAELKEKYESEGGE